MVFLGALLAIPALLDLSCATRGTYTTLAATDRATTLAYDGYLDSVIRGETRTNNLPIIAKSFDAIKAAERTAIDRAGGNTNAVVSGDLGSAVAAFITQVSKEKGTK